jgi:hypothetical protein
MPYNYYVFLIKNTVSIVHPNIGIPMAARLEHKQICNKTFVIENELHYCNMTGGTANTMK